MTEEDSLNNNNFANHSQTFFSPSRIIDTLKEKMASLDAEQKQAVLLKFVLENYDNAKLVFNTTELKSILTSVHPSHCVSALTMIGKTYSGLVSSVVPEIYQAFQQYKKNQHNFTALKEILNSIENAHPENEEVHKICDQYKPMEEQPFSQISPTKGSQSQV